MPFDRRTYAREYARKQRAAGFAARQAGRTACAFRLGRYRCEGQLEFRTNGAGVVVAVCARCERRRAGRCLDCPRHVVGAVGKALRCAACQRAALREMNRRSDEKYQAARRTAGREYGRAHRAERAAYKRLWRASRPEKKRQYAARYDAKHSEQQKRYHRAYYLFHGDRRATGPRTCIDGCGTMVHGRAKRCEACRVRHRRDARALIAARLTRGRAA